jgi:hypothetical protein
MTAQEMLDTIDQMLAAELQTTGGFNSTVGGVLAVLSAFRGPDDSYSAVVASRKQRTTAPIRARAFPRLIAAYNHTVGYAPFDHELRDEIMLHMDDPSHFAAHVAQAAHVLGLKVRVGNEPTSTGYARITLTDASGITHYD